MDWIHSITDYHGNLNQRNGEEMVLEMMLPGHFIRGDTKLLQSWMVSELPPQLLPNTNHWLSFHDHGLVGMQGF